MSRTNRNNPSDANYREARKGRVNHEGLWDNVRFSFRGGMVMGPAASGIWGDERPPSGANSRSGRHRDDQRRRAKKRERRLAMADALNN